MSRSEPNTKPSSAAWGLGRGFVIAVPAALALTYALGHLNWYLGTPLGRVPVLDERENLDLAEAIFGGSLPAEPFYRAPGYALALAGLRCAGVSARGLFPAALVLGVVLHAIGAGTVAVISRRLFGNIGALIGGLLFAFNPVLVHVATLALDATLSLTLFLIGLNSLLAALAAPGRRRAWALAGILWAAATLVRPNYLLCWMGVPAFALLQQGDWRMRWRALVPALAGVLVFGAMAAWQKKISGTAGFLPWQGAYNLWAANRPGANGRYYTQLVSLPPALARANPAREESIFLYARETQRAPADIASMNAHWRSRFLQEVTTHPVRWTALLARKTYALLNNWEQYNNKTFAFHKARSPWLASNPLCWGALLIGAVAGAARLSRESPRIAAAGAVVAAACAASTVLFYPSERFRIPLVGISTVLVAGALARPRFWLGWPPGRQAALAAGMVLAGLVAFSHFDNVDDRSTFVQDHVLLARAAYTVGDDDMALREAQEALLLQPWHPDAAIIAREARAEIATKAALPRVKGR